MNNEYTIYKTAYSDSAPYTLPYPKYNSLYPELLNKYQHTTFIETGCWRGQGIRAALDCGFKKVYSCDIDENWVNYCKSIYEDKLNVTIHNESSVEFLKKILNIEKEDITFWLDAHIPDCKVVNELEVIRECGVKNINILIDDFHRFETYREPEHPCGTWWKGVSVRDIIFKISEIGNNHSISIQNGMNLDGSASSNRILVATIH